MAGEILWINDTDSRDLGIYVMPGVKGILGATARPVELASVIGKPGGIIGRDGQHVPRLISIPARFHASSIDSVAADWAVVQQELLAREVLLRHAHAPDLEYTGRWIAEDATFADLALHPQQDLNLQFVCEHPFGRHVDDSPFTVEFDDTPTAIPSGLMACRGTLKLIGGTNPICRLHDPDGNVVESMTITRTHTGEQQTHVQSHLHKVTYHVDDDDEDGTSDRGSLTAGSFFEVDPLKYGARPMDDTPTYLKLSVTQGTGVFLYEKYS